MILLVSQLLLLLCGACAFFYEEGYDHHYTYSSESDILGLHNVTTVVKFRIRNVNSSSVAGSLNKLMVDSFVQHSEKGYFADNPMKWNLDREFLFNVDVDGLVFLVHHHPEDEHEILSLKKVLASTLSARVQIQDQPRWSFTSTELDHTGTLEHQYEGAKTTDGLRFVRTHRSSTDVHRLHTKILHLDGKSTPMHVEALDNVTLRSETSQIQRKSVEGEEEILDEQSGEFPKISSISRSTVKLTAKRHHPDSSFLQANNLLKDSLFVKQKAAKRVSIDSVRGDISRLITCIHKYPNKFERNRTECVNNLRNLLTSLHLTDFLKLSEEMLSRNCGVNDTICNDERNLFFDLTAGEGSHSSQKLLLDLIVQKFNVTEDEIRRFLFHCIALKDPLPELVRVVEDFCHSEKEKTYKDGVPALTKTSKRACLSLGALAKTLHETNISESDRVVKRLETWLEPYNHTKTLEIVKPRQRRSIAEYDHASQKLVETKMVLLQSLGNAGKKRSLNHITSYMEPTVSVSAWRRAAAHSLRHFTCNESASALLRTAVQDGDITVRQVATKVFGKHPKSQNVTKDQENIVLSKNYTYPVVARVRRGLMQTLIEGISVHIEPPGIEWDKVIGTDKIGAGFGLHIRNILDLKLGLLSGHFLIDVYDGAYAEAHVGLLNFQVDIVKAYICFKGHIGYNLNVLKDFGINSVQDLVHIYDKIVAKIIDPMIGAVKAFGDIIHLFKNGGIKKIFDTLVSTVKNLPHILGDVTKRLKEFVDEIFSIAGSVIMEEIKLIVGHVRAFVDGVKQDILKFYHDVVDPITMALPYIGKKITEAFNLIKDGFMHLLDNPMQAITGISRAITDIKMAVTMVFDVKGKIIDACMFLKGRATEWFNTAKEIPKIISRLQTAIQKLINSLIHRRSLTDDMENTFSNGVQSMKDSLLDLKQDLQAKWNNVLAPIRGLIDVAKPFLDGFKSIVDLIKGIKWTYKKLKDVINTSKALVQKVFGPKFDKKFPTDRREEKGRCKSGVWPTTTNNHYQTTGVDLTLGRGQSIAAPVDGIVNVKAKNRVVFEPTDVEFSGMEIVIENIEPERKADKKRFKSGKKIGKASKVNICKLNFIHVSVRKAQNATTADADYDYIDPSPFLDRLVPIPRWIPECNDYEFRFKGQTYESSESTDREPEFSSDKIKRTFEDSIGSADDLDAKMGGDGTVYRPEDEGLYDSTSFRDSLKNSLKEQTKQFAEFFKTALFSKDGPKVPNILEIVNVNGKSVNWILDKLDKGSDVYSQFTGVIESLSNGMTEIPSGNPATLAVPFMKRLLKLQGVNTISGGVADMATKLASAAETKCPIFKGAIATSFGHLCTARCDCLGLTCSLALPTGHKTTYIKIEVTIDVDKGELIMQYNDKKLTTDADGDDHELDLSVSLYGMKASVVGSMVLRGDTFYLTLEAKLCSELLMTCLPPIEVLTDIRFPSAKPKESPDCKAGGQSTASLEVSTEIQNMSIPTFINHLGDFERLTHNATHVLESVREAVVKQLMEDAVDKIGEIVKEFKDKVDFCLSANVPVQPFDVPIFGLTSYFLVGPVPLTLEFGAGGSVGLGVKLGFCVLSMTAKVTLTPWVGGKVWGDASINLGFARGGIKLVGHIIETRFPITIELVFSKYPIDLGSKMDLLLTPIRLKLTAYAKLNLLFTSVTVFEGTLWKYKAPTIHKNIFTKHKRDDDKSPPDIQPNTLNMRKKREGHRGCVVQQIPGRPYHDTACKLEMSAEDPVSDVKLSYAVGTHRGGTDLINWTEMGGTSLLVPAKLPGGVPIYWTVKAKNSQGLEATTQCFLNTYDNTLPDGRVEHSYRFSSHPTKLIASVIAFEDSPLVNKHYKAVGYSAGKFGSQFIGWQELRLDHSVDRIGATGNLKKFTIPREGKLVAFILKSQKTGTPEECAGLCISYGSNCVSFDYESHSETCDLHDLVQGANAYLRLSGTYSNYERLGTGYHTPIEYTNLPLTHGTIYFINANIRNVLGYEAFLVGEGTMVDFTTPEPGPVGLVSKDILRADNCTAAVTQRCLDTTWLNNHRIIIDGPGAGTIFNGHKPLYDELYTLTNHYISANWYGFHDDESGIWGYTWAVGRHICGTDVLLYTNPYAHLTNKKFWTDSGFEKGFHLADGAYYVTVQALNGAELGGSLVTTVCHAIPFNVDTTPPVFSGVTDIIYDEDFDLIAIYYQADDDISKIAKTEFGLGKTKYDVQLKSYSLHSVMERDDPFVSLKDLGLKEGIAAWIRIRVTNNVDLFTSGHGDEPILIDKSPPFPGNVLDGDRLQTDLKYQSSARRICAQWVDFYDPESGIDRFIWGVGTSPGIDDIVQFKNLTQYDKSSCSPAIMEHNQTYYSTVFAYNNALNSKVTNASSDGVLVDVTPPLPGFVVDGNVKDIQDQNYTSETVTKHCHWNGYFDPESGIDNYKVDVYINNELKDTFDVGQKEYFEDKTISLEHGDDVHFSVHGINGAGLGKAADSNGFIVDHTPPIMTELSDTNTGSLYQSQKNTMHLKWNFRDDESGIKEYRTVIYETKAGVKQRFWPNHSPYNLTNPWSKFSGRMLVTLDQLDMKDGGRYSLHVTSVNGALLSTAHESIGVTVDTTQPNEPKVHIGLWKEEEERNEANQILHDDQEGIRLSWSGRDSESGISNFLVAIGTTQLPELLLPYTSYGTETTAYIRNIHFETTSVSKTTYVVSVKAINGAGLESDPGFSGQIYIQKANVPGIVFDGRSVYEDASYTFDRTSLAASFYGFESESCNIIGYEWGIGTEAYSTDVLSFTDYGLVMENETHGYMQIHTELYENTRYFITVRAVTGCRDQYILSSSDGITLDTKPPTIYFENNPDNDTVVTAYNGVWYQDTVDSVSITANATDSNGLVLTQWALGSLPHSSNLHGYVDDFSVISTAVMLSPGKAAYITAISTDKAGNTNISSSFPVIGDDSPPIIKNLNCTKYISLRQGLVTCTWDKVVELESHVDSVLVSIGTEPQRGDILNSYKQPLNKRSFIRDLTNTIKNNYNHTSFYFDFQIINVVGRINEYEQHVVADYSPPKVEIVNIVTRTNDKQPLRPLKCQLPRSYVEVQIERFSDEQSGIDQARFQIALGSTAFATDIAAFQSVTMNDNTCNVFFLDGFTIPPGNIFHATVRSYNKAGLYSDSSSSAVVVSQSPYLEVIDGTGDQDIDFQSVPNIIQGRWKYSDACPILEAKWKIHDLVGNILEGYRLIPNAGLNFYNDEVHLENGVKYFVTVSTVDALNRTKIATSNGVTVRIQPPYPGQVRDGLREDVNYQYSTTEFSANWDSFGDSTNDPTQSIHHYEVAIGNDRRYASTRTNVHFFVNVGLNISHTFKHLNLTSKLVRYYVTVRAYNLAGGFAEGYSNGIRVGYQEEIVPGHIEYDQFQSSTTSLSLSWSGFQSDIGIIQYKVAISSHENLHTNDTIACTQFEQNRTAFDILPLKTVGLNEFVKIDQLTLVHGGSYFPTVMAEDESGMCTAVTGYPIIVDTTLPTLGDIYVNGLLSNSLLFAKSSSELHIKWDSFNDPESGIESIKITLFECPSCDTKTTSSCLILAEAVVQNGTSVHFYELDLVSTKSYKIRLVITNGAGSSVVKYSSIVLLDVSPPNGGVVKITNDWNNTKSFQFQNDVITGKLAMTLSEETFICSNQLNYYPTQNTHGWTLMDESYSVDFSNVNTTGAYLGLGYNGDFSEITKSGISSPFMDFRDGNYTVIIRAARGFNIVTTVALVSSSNAVPYSLNEKPIQEEFDYSLFDNKTGLTLHDNKTETGGDSNITTVTTVSPGKFVKTNVSEETNTTSLEVDGFGIGVHLLGYKIGSNNMYHGLFWANNRFSSVKRWFQLNFNPTEKEHSYSISIKSVISNLKTTTDLSLFVDDQEVVSINGLRVGTDIKVALSTWNENDYRPPLPDIFHPFYTESYIRSIDIPDARAKPCLQGKPFYDGESAIKEIWAGVSDKTTAMDNISPFQKVFEFCFPCKEPCTSMCKDDCNNTKLTSDYTVLDLNVTDLDLQEVALDNDCMNVTSEIYCNSTAYYLTTKIVNFAGQATYSHSNAIQIDRTPPECMYMKCLDPDYSKDEPTSHIGSSSTIGSYWNCSEDVSIIDHYLVHITSVDNQDILMEPTNVGIKSKVSFNLGKDSFADKHDYMVHMTVVNNAGLSSAYNCSVQVNLYPPNVSTTDTKPLYAADINQEDGVALTDSQYEMGISWTGGNKDIEFYEWRLGSYPDAEDVFPPVKVGVNSTGSAAIVHGKLKLNKADMNKTVSEFQKKDNLTGITPTEHPVTEREKTFFSLEPGRCVFQTLYAIGWSHLKSKMKSKTVCVKRSQDIQTEAALVKHNQLISKIKSTRVWQRDRLYSPSETEIIIEVEISDGSFMAGSLLEDDKTAAYGTAATSEFKPYISDPKLSGSRTSRLLRNRILQYCNVSFYISPSPVTHFQEIKVNVTLPDNCKGTADYQPALMYWNADEEHWQHVDEGCFPYLTARGTDEVYMSNVCPHAKNDTQGSRKRSLAGTITAPRAYELVKILRSFPNNPPNITTTKLVVKEDALFTELIQTFDLENDDLVFDLISGPQHAVCSLTIKGILNCSLEEDFYGNDQITIRITETGLPQFERPFSMEKTIPIYVQPTPDKTERFFLDENGQIYREKRPSMIQVFHTDANDTTSYFVGTIILADVDGGEIFNHRSLIRFTALGNSTYSLKETTLSINTTTDLMASKYRTLKAYDVRFSYSGAISGKMTLNFIAKTVDSYTPSVTLDLYILKNPCVHGICSHRKTGTAGCNDLTRSVSFDKFECICAAGYTGEWCQIEVNECAPEPCALMFDCEDLVNGYQCNINIPKLMAILLCSTIAIAGVLFVVMRLIKRHQRRYNKVGQSSISLMNQNATEIEQAMRPRSSGSVLLEPTGNGIPPFGTSGQADIWENPAFDTKRRHNIAEPSIELSSLSMFGLGKKGPAHHMHITKSNRQNKTDVEESNRKMELLLKNEGDSPSASPKDSTSNVVLEDRSPSRMTDIEV